MIWGVQLQGEEPPAYRDEPVEELVSDQQEVVASDEEAVATHSEPKAPLSRLARRERDRTASAAADPVKPAVQEEVKKPEVRKRLKAHFVGSKRPPQNAPGYVPEPKVKKSSHIKNEWVSSKTHPKTPQVQEDDQAKSSSQTKGSFGEGNALSSPRRSPRYLSTEGLLAQAESEKPMPMKKQPSEEKETDEGKEYPHVGFIAPDAHIYMTTEWIYWRTRQGGMEYAVERESSSPGVFTDAVGKKVDIDWQSGFRVGLGVHLPYDGWDLYVNYTDFRPEDSSSASGSVFPLLLYQGQGAVGNVTEAHGHWEITFQTLDLEIGRAYYIGKSLALRPNIGMRGAWIDQEAHFNYRGGDVPAEDGYILHNKNNFKGAGIRAGINSNWVLGAGFSFNGDLFGSLVIGHFFLSQHQKQINGIEAIDLKTNLKQLSPNAQLFLGLSWDRNFHQEMCHFGLTFGLESQYWWRQNQMARFTDSSQPIYVRSGEDLAFYGINVKARLDF